MSFEKARTYEKNANKAFEEKATINKLEKMIYNPFVVTYNIHSMTYSIAIRGFGGTVFHKNISVYAYSNFNDYLTSIVDWFVDYCFKMQEVRKKSESEIPDNLIKNKIEVASHGFGICSYPNLGTIRKAWAKFSIEGVHDQWMQLFVKKKELLIDKSFNQISMLRKHAPTDHRNWGEHPPSVPIIKKEIEDCVKEYVEANKQEIALAVQNLPLNKTKFREDYDYSVFIMLKDGDYLKPAQESDIANPDAELWTVLPIGWTSSNRTYDGWAKKLGGEDVVSITTNHNNTPFKYNRKYTYIEDVAKSSIIKKGTSYVYIYKVVEKVSEKDELIDHLLDKSAQEFVEKMEKETLK